MALSVGVGVEDVGMIFSSLSVIVEVDGVREKPGSAVRCVSFNSAFC